MSGMISLISVYNGGFSAAITLKIATWIKYYKRVIECLTLEYCSSFVFSTSVRVVSYTPCLIEKKDRI
jgi:hypothetical protein